MRTALRLFLIVSLLVTSMSLWASGGGEEEGSAAEPEMMEATGTYREAPMLAEMVAAGEIPPVDERLPAEPFVWEVPEVGKYGGRMTTFTPNINAWGDLQEAPEIGPSMMRVLPDGSIVPELLSDVDVAEGGAGYVVTMTIREGLKWSDGDDVTTEDVEFAIYDINQHEEIGTWGYALANRVGADSENRADDSFEVVDEYTFRFEMASWEPTSLIPYTNWGAAEWGNIMPSHHYKPWHIDYNEDANAVAEEMGFESWSDLINWSLPFGGVQKDLERPTLQAWDHISSSNDVKSYVRNPYFLTVDQAGNQLPYVDEIVVQVVDPETYHLKIASGEMDFGYAHTSLENYTLYKENEASGNYVVKLLPGVLGAEQAFRLNPLHEDPTYAEVLGNIKFRQALSLAIDREEINEVLFQGVATPRQATANPDSSYFDESFNRFAVFDPDRANELLDEVGMTQRDSDGFRMAPNGESFQIIMEHNQPDPKLFFLVEEYWENIGINTEILFEERTLYRARRQDGLYTIMAEPLPRTNEFAAWTGKDSLGISVLFHNPWALWLQATWEIRDGVSTRQEILDENDGVFPGIEPPEWVQRVRELSILQKREPWQSDKFIEYAHEFYDIHAEQNLVIGTVGLAPRPVIARPNLKNVPELNPPEKGHISLNTYAWQFFYD